MLTVTPSTPYNNVAEYVTWFHENWFVSDQKKKIVGGIIFLYN